eukprot:494805-Pleurochrysis_carterae.AAC.1
MQLAQTRVQPARWPFTDQINWSKVRLDQFRSEIESSIFNSENWMSKRARRHLFAGAQERGRANAGEYRTRKFGIPALERTP